jgi:2-dehydro-3-deoxyphosphogluconate aldolase/(4S)-4-hydroxy-2-oxoglutarate aldolase
MEKREQLALIESTKLIAILRLQQAGGLITTAGALCEGGVKVMEFSLTTPGALTAITVAVEVLPSDVLLGAGTVLDAEMAKAALLAGAEFIVTPTFNPDVVKVCRSHGRAVIAGALTPTEILSAWRAGADLVKVFPASLGGPGYIRAILAPLPDVKLVAVGGVSVENAAQFIAAGAVAVGVGGRLVDSEAVEQGALARVTRTARSLVNGLVFDGGERP